MAEGVSNANGNTIIAMMSLAMKLEQIGVNEIHQAISLMLSEEDLDHFSPSSNASSSLWIAGMDTELLSNIQDEMAKLARLMRKYYCIYYSS